MSYYVKHPFGGYAAAVVAAALGVAETQWIFREARDLNCLNSSFSMPPTMMAMTTTETAKTMMPMTIRKHFLSYFIHNLTVFPFNNFTICFLFYSQIQFDEKLGHIATLVQQNVQFLFLFCI